MRGHPLQATSNSNELQTAFYSTCNSNINEEVLKVQNLQMQQRVPPVFMSGSAGVLDPMKRNRPFSAIVKLGVQAFQQPIIAASPGDFQFSHL